MSNKKTTKKNNEKKRKKERLKKNQPKTIKDISNYVKTGEKPDGVSEGGIYSLKNENSDKKGPLYMLKKMDPYSAAAEYVGSHIAKLYIGNSSPTVDLVKGNDGSIYVASEFIPNFQTLKDFSAKLGIPKECFPYGCVVDQDGNHQPIVPHLQQQLLKNQITSNEPVSGAEEVNIVAEFLQHDDTHDRNRGISTHNKAGSTPTIAAVIDWSWSLRGNNLDSPIVYYSNNYDPEKVVLAIDRIVNTPLDQIKNSTEPLFANLKECYGSEAVFNGGVSPRNYLQHLASLVLPTWTPNLNIDDLKSTMFSSLEKRSQKLEEEKIKLERFIARKSHTLQTSSKSKVPKRTVTYQNLEHIITDPNIPHINATRRSSHLSLDTFLNNTQPTQPLRSPTNRAIDTTNLSTTDPLLVGTAVLATAIATRLIRKATKQKNGRAP